MTVMSGPGGQVPFWPAISPPLQTVRFSLVIPSSAVFPTFETSQSNRLEILFIMWLHSVGQGQPFPHLGMLQVTHYFVPNIIILKQVRDHTGVAQHF